MPAKPRHLSTQQPPHAPSGFQCTICSSRCRRSTLRVTSDTGTSPRASRPQARCTLRRGSPRMSCASLWKAPLNIASSTRLCPLSAAASGGKNSGLMLQRAGWVGGLTLECSDGGSVHNRGFHQPDAMARRKTSPGRNGSSPQDYRRTCSAASASAETARGRRLSH